MKSDRHDELVDLDFQELTEPERYDLDEAPAYRFELDRRDFLVVLGAGILVTTTFRGTIAQDGSGRRGGTRGDGSLDDRLHIGVDGVVTVLTGKVEVGQGSRTQITMAAAEELRLPMSSVRLVMADSAVVPDDGSTAGSRTTPSTVPRIRRACAAARRLLVETAAREWGVDAKAIRVEGGKLSVAGTDHEATYGDIVARSLRDGLGGDSDGDGGITAVSEWKVLGSSPARVDAEAIVTGRHRYPSDVRRPGMLFGVVVRPPSLGASLESIDLAPARALEGVAAVRDGDFVGVAAPTSARAREAARSIEATTRWREPTAHASSDELYERLVATQSSGGGRRGGPRERGDVDATLAGAAKSIRERYHIAYVQHAPMETRAAVAEWEGDRLTVWTGTQNPGRVRDQIAEAFRLRREGVRVVVPDTGGGFGGKHTGEVAIEAARIAREAGRPVSLQWTREEEFTWAYFRPAGVIEVAGALDAAGRLTAWEQTNWNSGGSAIDTPYTVPATRSQFRGSDAPLRQGSYRALASTANVFARESAMDELAMLAGADPLEFRLRHLEEPRLRAVLEAAAERFQWRRRARELAREDRPRRRGVGLSCGTEKGSFTAACAEIEFPEGESGYRVIEVCQAFECGAIHHPENLRAQVEGCLLQGLGAALWEEIRFDRGRVRNARFSRYRVPRLADVPRIEIVLLDRSDLASVGGSETPIVAIAPAVANAIFDARGARLRALPLTGEGIVPI